MDIKPLNNVAATAITTSQLKDSFACNTGAILKQQDASTLRQDNMPYSPASQVTLSTATLSNTTLSNLVVSSSLATTSTTSTTKASAATYEPAPINVIQLRHSYDKSPVAQEVSKQLSSNINSISAHKSGFASRGIFQQIGALSRTTSDYKNEARSTRITDDTIPDKLTLDFSKPAGKPTEAVNLNIRTKDGDTIDIQLQHTAGTNSDGLTFSFTVKGKLSEQEQDALEKLATKLSDVADNFFRTGTPDKAGTTQLNGLKEFDQTVLENFHIDFSKPKGDNYATMSYDFSVDTNNKTQTLHAKDAEGYSADITTDLKGLITGSNVSQNALQSYLNIINKALDEHQTNSRSQQFILDSFSSMVATTQQQENINNNPTTETLQAFDSGLPDFNATIRAPLQQDDSKYAFPEVLSLTLEQHTETQTINDKTFIKQTNSYELNSTHIKGIDGHDKNMLAGDFDYVTTHEKQQISRTLNLSANQADNLIIEKNKTINNTEKIFNHFTLQDTRKDQRHEQHTSQMADAIKMYKDAGKVFNRNAYVADSKMHLFE